MLVALPNAFGDAATNMAIDAALLASLPQGLAAFRHYGWTEPAATFGYAQAYSSILETFPGGQSSNSAAVQPLRLVRRLTGGGIVDHLNDWTYALIIHATLPSAKAPATEVYERIHRAIGQTLEGLGTETRLAPCPKACASALPTSHIQYPISKHPSASRCFASPAANDVLRPDGRKIAGAAMKRNRDGLLIQGSIDRGALPEAFDFATFQAQFIADLAGRLDLTTGTLEDIRPLFKSARIEQEKKRFASDTWNRRR